MKPQSDQTTARVVNLASCLWLPFLINRVLNLTMSWSVMYDQAVDSSYFPFWELISTAQLKTISWRTRVPKRLLEFAHRCPSPLATLFNQQSTGLNKVEKGNIRSICKQQLFHSLRPHQYSSDQKILVSVPYRLWLPFSINRAPNLTELRTAINDQSVRIRCFTLLELISTAKLERRSWRNRMLKPLLELWALHIACGYLSRSTECST